MPEIEEFAAAITLLRNKSGRVGFNGTTAPLGEIAELMRPLLARGLGLLGVEQRRPAADERRKVPLWSDPGGSFTVLATIWAPGQSTPIHDHEYWDVSGILSGAILEHHYAAREEECVQPISASFHHPGAVWSLTPTRPNIHTLCNPTRDLAISLNVHGTGEGRYERNFVRMFRLAPEFLPLLPSA